MSNPIAALIERLNHHYWSVVLPFNPKTDTPRTDAELQRKLQLTITKMQETIFQMRLQREESKRKREERKRERTMVRLQYPPSEHTEDEFLRVISELAKLTQQSKGEVLANSLNLYYRVVTLPAADLELLRSFLEDLEKKQGIDWSATANPPEPPSVA
jgi:hypothetical protein